MHNPHTVIGLKHPSFRQPKADAQQVPRLQNHDTHSQSAYRVFVTSLRRSTTHLCVKHSTQLPRLRNMISECHNDVTLR